MDGNVLFNDALNTFYLRLYGIGHVAREVICCCHYLGYYFRLAARFLLHALTTDRIAYAMDFVIPVMEHWLECKIAQSVLYEYKRRLTAKQNE